MNAGDEKKFKISIETEYFKGHPFCLYDVHCKFVNSNSGTTMVGKTGVEPITSAQFPVSRIKIISMDENGKDIHRYKTKSEGEIDLQDFTSFMFGSILQYQCGPGRMFELNEREHNILTSNQSANYSVFFNRFYEKLNISCNWNEKWSLPSFVVPKCVCKCKLFPLILILYLIFIYSDV